MKGTIKSCGLIINGLAGNPTGLGKMFGSNGLSVVFGGMPNLIRIGSASTHGERSP
jgi:hypothetical protein